MAGPQAPIDLERNMLGGATASVVPPLFSPGDATATAHRTPSAVVSECVWLPRQRPTSEARGKRFRNSDLWGHKTV